MKPRKIAISPNQNAILWLLEEAGEEDLRTIQASLKISDEELVRAVAGLERLQFVESTMVDGSPALRLTERGLASLTR